MQTQISQPGMPEAHYALDVLQTKVIDVPDSKTIHTEALTQDSMDKLTALGLKVETLPDGTVLVTADTDDGQNAIDNFIARNNGKSVDVYVEIQARRRAGGVADDFVGPSIYDAGMADGGVRQRANGSLDQAHIAPGRGNGTLTSTPLGPVRYAEGETGWEAYIPGAQSKRRRSEQILQEVADRFGFGLVKMANGGIVEGMSAVAATQFPALQITDSYRPGANDHHGAGKAIDMSNGYGNTDEMLAAANYIADNYPNSLELIYDDPRFNRQIKNGQIVGRDFYAGAGDHTNHVHWAMPEPPGAPAGAQSNDSGPEQAAPPTFTRDDLTQDLTTGTTDTGVTMSTDGQRVFVTNWPAALGGAEKPAEERTPIWSASIRAFDQGGLRDAHIAADGADLIRYAEKGTGGEAYIPLAPAKRGRSVGLTREVAHRFGFELVPMENGGLTGFGGYVGDKGSTFDVPLTAEGWANMSPNKRRATMYNLAALGIGGAFAIASGFDENGAFTGQFDTGANSHPGLEKAFGDWADRIAEQLEAIKKAAENPNPVDVQVDIDSGSRTAQIEITKRGL